MTAIPPTEPVLASGRNLILCFDGTGAQYDGYASYLLIHSRSKMFTQLAEHESRQIIRAAEEGRFQATTLLLPGS